MRNQERKPTPLERRVKRLETIVADIQKRLNLGLDPKGYAKTGQSQTFVETMAISTPVSTKPFYYNQLAETTVISDALLRTLSTVKKSKNMITADDVATLTGRSKNLESGYLHSLYEMGFLRRKRRGRRVYYQYPTLKEA